MVVKHTIENTSRTLVDILKEPDCPERRFRVEELVNIYQPVWEVVAKKILISYGGQNNATLDANDIVGNEIVNMLDPDNDYFRLQDPERGSLRSWIKARIHNKCVDLLRRKGVDRKSKEVLLQQSENVHPDDILRRKGVERRSMESYKTVEVSEIEIFTDEREMYEIFREALSVAEQLCDERGIKEKMKIFRAVRGADVKISEDSENKEWTEWRKREAVSSVWDIVRDEAIPLAAQKVAVNTEEAESVAKELWDWLKNRKKFSLPE